MIILKTFSLAFKWQAHSERGREGKWAIGRIGSMQREGKVEAKKGQIKCQHGQKGQLKK